MAISKVKLKKILFFLLLSAIFCLGLYIIRFSINRLPAGEDDSHYLGAIRQAVEFKKVNFKVVDLIAHPQNKLLLFYLLGKPWVLFQHQISFMQYFNILYFILYLGSFLSFYRLSLLSKAKFNQILALLFFSLMVSSTFWLGPRYFVPSLWLYIAIPNIIFCSFNKKYIESILWVISTYFLYYFGLPVALLVFFVATTLFLVKPIWLRLIIITIIFLAFYNYGLGYAAEFIGGVKVQSVVESSLIILYYFNLAFFVGVILSLSLSILYKQSIKWPEIFLSFVLFFIFYWIVQFFPRDTAAYRLIIMLQISIVLMLISLPDLFSKKNIHLFCFSLMITAAFSYFFIQLLIINIEQNREDLQIVGVKSEEVSLFNYIDQACRSSKCLIISDPSTLLVGSYFSPVFGSFNPDYLKNALADPLSFSKQKDYDHIFLIVSKRTTVLFRYQPIQKIKGQFSRSYDNSQINPLMIYGSLIKYKDNIAYKNENLGLYAFDLKLLNQ